MPRDFQDPARRYVPAEKITMPVAERFAPADNLFDAIRADVAAIGGVDFEPLRRRYDSELPFNDIDENPFEE
jgi:hypothetical protein